MLHMHPGHNQTFSNFYALPDFLLLAFLYPWRHLRYGKVVLSIHSSSVLASKQGIAYSLEVSTAGRVCHSPSRLECVYGNRAKESRCFSWSSSCSFEQCRPECKVLYILTLVGVYFFYDSAWSAIAARASLRAELVVAVSFATKFCP